MTPWTVARLGPLSMEFSRQEYWSGLPFPSPGDLPDPGTEPRSPTLQADSLLTKLLGTIVYHWLSGEKSACNAGATGHVGSNPGSRRSPGEGHGNPLQYSCLENLMGRGAWQAMVNSVAKSQTQLKRLSKHAQV